MPIYEYVCDSCNHQFETEQSMREDPLTICPRCSGKIRRVFGLNSVIFKGSGFYCNDSKKKEASSSDGAATPCANCPVASGASS